MTDSILGSDSPGATPIGDVSGLIPPPRRRRKGKASSDAVVGGGAGTTV